MSPSKIRKIARDIKLNFTLSIVLTSYLPGEMMELIMILFFWYFS